MSLNSNALVSLALAKTHLDINPNTTSEDARLEFFINAASERVASWCDRIFQQGIYTEIHSGRRQNYLLPQQYPVTAITSIVINNSRDWSDASSLVDPTKYIVTDFQGTIQYDGIFPTGYNNIQIIYTAGYTTFPSDLQLAALWFVEWYYRHRTRGDMGRTTMSKGDENVGILAETPKMILQILQDYQRCEFNNTESPVRNS